MAIVRLRNVSPVGALDVELLRGRLPDRLDESGQPVPCTVVRHLEEFDVDEALAGTLPGTWRAPRDAEAADGLAGLQARPVDPADPDGPVEVCCPGTGLLATGNFELVDQEA